MIVFIVTQNFLTRKQIQANGFGLRKRLGLGQQNASIWFLGNALVWFSKSPLNFVLGNALIVAQ